MFERYTEQARRVIFFARYEASQFGSQEMEPEHFLLALLREDPGLMKRFLPHTAGEEIRQQIQRETAPRAKISVSVDLPLSHTAKRVLAYGAEEAMRMNHSHIGTEHHLLGLLRAPSLAARILESRGVTLEGARQEIAKSGVNSASVPLTPEEAAIERETLTSLIASLPDDALRRARRMLEQVKAFPGQGIQSGRPLTGKLGLTGNFSRGRMENGTMIFETRRVHQGHRITLIEKLRVSDDGKTLHYSQELRGPKGEHSWSQDFDIT